MFDSLSSACPHFGSYSGHYLVFGKLSQLLPHVNSFLDVMVIHHNNGEEMSELPVKSLKQHNIQVTLMGKMGRGVVFLVCINRSFFVLGRYECPFVCVLQVSFEQLLFI